MSNRYKGGIISATPPTTTGGESGTASGAWTLEQQMQLTAAGLWPLQPTGPYIEDVFSTWLYTGNAAARTINNGIDLAGKGGLTWIKSRNGTGTFHYLFDTARGATNYLSSNLTNAQATDANSLTAFNANGFSLGPSGRVNDNDTAANNYASWTFREQPKFFDVVTFSTTTGSSVPITVNHNLGSVPGCIIVKKINTTGGWNVYHRSLGSFYLELSSTDFAQNGGTSKWFSTPTATSFTLGGDFVENATYIAYLFAHNAGGFGLSGTDNVISCGSYTGAGASTTVTLGYEPQWILIKRSNTTGPWHLQDVMRGATVTATDNGVLYPNTSQAEQQKGSHVFPTATGFAFTANEADINEAGSTYIYIAIRRGPMRTPTTGTSVFDAGTRSGSGSVAKTNSNILTDLTFIKNRTSGGEYWAWTPRLTGNLTLQSNSTDPELTGAMATNPWDTMTGAFCAASNGATNSGSLIDYSFRRAPGFHDVVCYTGTGSATTFTHNLGVAPELIIVKSRSTGSPTYGWAVGTQFSASTYRFLILNTTDGLPLDNYGAIFNAQPTPTGFRVGTWGDVNTSGTTYVAYLFATCPGVSKVGSYTGTGTTQLINCGFTGGARFVMIKRADSTGGWYVWDSARGIVAGNDPYLLLNSTAAEVTNTDYIDTAATGFEITSTAPAAINASGGTFIFLAIA